MSMAKSKEEEDEAAKTDGLEIISIGRLYNGPWDKKYWSCSRGKDRYPYPIGYQAVRAHGGSRCKIEVREGSKGPLFTVTAADGHSCSGQTPNIAWDRFQKKGFPRMKIWHGKRFSCKIDGTEFFGFKDPLVQRLLRELVANVDGIAEPNLLSSSFCGGPSLTEQVLRCPSSCSYPDLLACLVEPRITRKRSRRPENKGTRSSSEVPFERLQTSVLENFKNSNPGGTGHGSQWKRYSVSSCIYSASGGDKIICGSPGILLKQMNSNILTKYDGVEAAGAKNLESPEDHKSTGLTQCVSTAEESLDRFKDGAAPGSSSSVEMERNIEEPVFVNDSGVNVSDMSLCALDTYDSLQDNGDKSHDHALTSLSKTSFNSQGVVAANHKSDFEGLVAESHPGGEMDKDPLTCSSEKSDLDSVGQDVAKSMMTVLLPQALPLLKEASRKKSEAKQGVSDRGHLSGVVEFEEKNADLANYGNARVEKEENMLVLAADSASIIRSSKNGNAIAPDSFEDKLNDVSMSGTNSVFHLDEMHVPPREKIQGDRADLRNVFQHGSLDLPTEWANMSTDSFSFEEGLIAASDCISDAYDWGRTNHEADAKAGLGNDRAMVECNTLLTGNSQCPRSEGTVDRIFRNGCSAERCTAAGDFLCQELNDEPGHTDIAKILTVGQSNHVPTEMPTTSVKHNTNEDPNGSQVQAPVYALVKKNILSFPSAQPIDEKPRNSLPYLVSATDMLDCMTDTANKDQAVPQLKSSGNVQLNNEQKSIYQLIGCYVHPLPIVAVWLSTHENETYICILCGLEEDKVKTLFLYNIPTEHAGEGCPSFLGHTPVTLPIPQNIYGGRIAPERSYLQFTPHGKGLVFLGCMEAPCCRERRISCSCSTCALVSFDETAVRIVQANMGYVTLVATLKAIDRVHSIVVCEPNYLVAIGESGRLHLWAMNPAWSAETEEFDIPTSDCVSPCIVELKKIPRHAYLVVGHNGLGEFSLWDVSKRIFLSKFSHPNPSVSTFLPISLLRWRRQDFISGRNLEEHVDVIMEATMKGFSGHDANHTFLHLEEEDIALWLLVAAVSDVECDYQLNARRKDSVVEWRLALLAEKMVILGNTLDQRVASVGVLTGQGIIATNEGHVYMWELSTGKRLGTLHHFPGGSVSCIATNDSTPAVFAAAGDGGKLLVYRHSQFKAMDRK
ncbi:uncharacterized protein LOC115752852 isoform X2 [Rhodamnia argentea]|uniref:Uncharacterized protein LOC115752852 isoform X2 n=1 Tax=Rhodamnia argentea TaxID=178133 RepID=A0ABM3HDS9_9MYRT|nr:uncharacterized protein LOC115752852 isoform X2 [Rhodamnia argentea]